MSTESVVEHSDSDAAALSIRGEHGRVSSLAAALADQGAQSLISLVLSVVAARALTADDFGRFSVAFIVLTVTWGLLRALATEPFIVSYASRTASETDAQLAPFTRLLLRIVLPLSAMSLAASAALDGMWRSSAVFLAAALPLIVVLEAVRAINLAGRRSRELLVTGGVWLSLFIGASILTVALSTSVVPILIAYCGVTAVAAAVGAVRIIGRRRSAKPGAPGSLDHRSLLRRGAPLALEFLVTAASVNLLVVVVALAAGLEESAGLRGAMVLAGPITTLMGGLRLGALADATRYRTRFGDTRWAAYAIRLSSGLLGIGAVGVVAIALAARSFGDDLLGATWPLTKPALLPFLLASLLTATHLTAASILRARDMGERALFVRIVTTPTAIVPAVVGALIDGAAGASLGYAAGVAIATPIWLRAATRREGT